MGRCLILANQTLGGAALDEAVRDCMSRQVRRFHVAVPVTPAEHETSSWAGGFLVAEGGWSPEAARQMQEAMEEEDRRRAAARAEAERRARERLDRMIERIRAAGGEADGELGAGDPAQAAKEVLERETFDEVIVSTLPSGLSRWLKMDLPSRVARMTDAPVTTVEAEPETADDT